MSEIIESNNLNQRPSIIRFLVPGVSQTLLDLLIGGLLLTLLNFGALWHYLNGRVTAYDQDNGTALFDQGPSWLHKTLHIISVGRVPQIVFWILVGCAIYTIVWFIKNALVNISNDIVAGQFLLPENEKKKTYWSSILVYKFFLVFIIVVSLAYVFAVFRLMPVLARLCHSAVGDFRLFQSSLELVGSLVASAVLLQIFLILIHLIINAWSTVNNGL